MRQEVKDNFNHPKVLEDDIQTAVGRWVLCEDGKTRRIQDITQSFVFGKHDMFQINMFDPEMPGGHFVHAYVITSAIIGTPLPTKEMRHHLTRLAKRTVLAKIRANKKPR